MLLFSTSYVCYGANYFQEQPKETFTEYRGMVVDRDTKDPLAFVKTNIIGTVNLLNVSRKFWSGECHICRDIW